jgi:hypothetical protein
MKETAPAGLILESVLRWILPLILFGITQSVLLPRVGFSGDAREGWTTLDVRMRAGFSCASLEDRTFWIAMPADYLKKKRSQIWQVQRGFKYGVIDKQTFLTELFKCTRTKSAHLNIFGHGHRATLAPGLSSW